MLYCFLCLNDWMMISHQPIRDKFTLATSFNNNIISKYNMYIKRYWHLYENQSICLFLRFTYTSVLLQNTHYYNVKICLIN